MKVKDYLQKKRFHFKEIRSPKGFQAKMNCPSCDDPNSFAISLESGAYYCFRLNKCGIKGSFTDFQKMFGDIPQHLDKDKFLIIQKNFHTPKIQSEPVNSKVLEYFRKRSILDNIVQQFDIGYLDNCILFQYKKDGKLVNVKYRSLTE